LNQVILLLMDDEVQEAMKVELDAADSELLHVLTLS
jgi:hypothetical protein